MSHQGRVRGRGRWYHSKNIRTEQVNHTPTTIQQNQESNMALQANENISEWHDPRCCGLINIKLPLDEDGLLFFSELKRLWTMLKKSPPVISKLHNYFAASANPFVDTLRLLYNCQDFHNAKAKTLPMFIIEEFKSWSTINANRISHLLTIELKIDVFKILLRQNSPTLTKLVVEVFRMVEDQDVFFNIIRCVNGRKKYKEACQYAMIFGLQDRFSIEDFLIPLVLQDKLFLVDDFLRSSPRHQAELVIWLDDMLGNNSIRDAAADYALKHGIPEVKYDKMHSKPWKKLIARLLKMFKLSFDLTPNLNKKRNEGALNFLLHKRFVENSFGDESWKEMVQEAVGDEEVLKKELVHQVAHYGDPAEALWWAHFYNVDKNDWPYTVRMLEENPDGNRAQQKIAPQDEESWEDELVEPEPVDYHKMPLSFDAILLVDSPVKFEDFLDTGFQDVDLIGIDCEWKPSFGGNANELALMQIATRKNVFVLDIVNLGNKIPHLWQELGKFIFNNCDILKLGFSITGDIHMIRQALPDLNFSPKHVGFLDLCSLWKHLEKFPKVKLPYEVQTGGPSLSTLVHHCLGRPLDKSEQFSNWEKRPLRDTQVAYAALDAYCLIQAYDVIRRCCDEAGFPFEETCYHLLTNDKQAKKKHKKPHGHRKRPVTAEKEIPQAPSPHSDPVSADKLKVVCDTMLQGLGKKLRSCGIDSVILETNQDHMVCVKYAQDERRYILTRGYETFKMLQGYVPSGHCLKIKSDDVDEQIKEVINYYKVSVTKEHVFSRCQACNGNNFVKISQSTMNTLAKSAENHDYSASNCFYEDEATGFSSEGEDGLEEAGPPASRNRKWELYPDEKVDVGLCQTRLGAKIQVKAIPKPLMTQHDFFYVCEECGKVYWDGSHFGKVMAGRLQGIVQ
ncbi:unnamed protein product [Callosobruchus maculatus]|uniref:3'-5' exonuclease domain-containing protein n=1 Tax=Callosobruchus maculatus TaxID=64391 RepID=A0A653BKY7_CALMS|nr:unnamed protein product [Callosobruchus maculatus]